jgi:demethoxyubiquinone hydroxylase (CLK1/Coq7/Cat5 family)
VCSREIAVYRRQPGAERCEWVDASICDEASLGPGLDRARALERLHVRRPDGTLVSGARGFAAMWSALPRTAALGRFASAGPMPWLLEGAYRGFLRVRRAWRAVPAPYPLAVVADLRTDHAGEVGATWIYRGVLAVSRDASVRSFAARHLATERAHLATIESLLPSAHRSRLLPAWRAAGWATGALPALFGARVVHATIAVVETFVDGHYAGQVARLDAMPADPALASLRAELERCRADEVAHRDEAAALAATPAGPLLRAWLAAVSVGSAAAVALARRI